MDRIDRQIILYNVLVCTLQVKSIQVFKTSYKLNKFQKNQQKKFVRFWKLKIFNFFFSLAKDKNSLPMGASSDVISNLIGQTIKS